MVEDITLRLVHGLVKALERMLVARACYKDVRVTYPVLLEAFLRAEEAIFNAELQAGRALEGSRIALAVMSKTLFLCGRLRHGVGVGVVWWDF